MHDKNNGHSLTTLIGTPVTDASGRICGRLKDIAVGTGAEAGRVVGLVLKTREGAKLVPATEVRETPSGVLELRPTAELRVVPHDGSFLLLRQDLLDRQIIDVHGRKVVRVNDVDIHEEVGHGHVVLKLSSVDVGARGAVRRLLKGVVPRAALRPFLARIPPRLIPWEFVDLIEVDPARRVKLKISLDRLATLHPADIADIVEELAPAEREAVFQTLDEDVAAQTLEEVDPKVQVSILSSLDSDRAADIVEEMDPDAAADVLGDMPPEASHEILTEMEPEEREEVAELMAFEEDTAAGRMTTEYLALPANATVHDAIEALRSFEGGIETVSTIYLLDPEGRLVGAVMLPKLVLAQSGEPLLPLSMEPLISCQAGANEKEVAERFDKYNLLTLPVVDDEGKLTGVITSDDVISLLRAKL
jgi:CBS domain-containing protein/sporulation protein YlmC with PRC-barrel domain